MGDVAIANRAWGFTAPHAQLLQGELAGCVDVSRPELGLHQLSFGGRQQPGHILAVRPSVPSGQTAAPSSRERPNAVDAWRMAESYVRGEDLVATYEPKTDWPYSTQIYWSAISAAIDAVSSSLAIHVSLQTHLLDTWPKLVVHSQLHVEDALLIMCVPGRQAQVEQLRPGGKTYQPESGACGVLLRLAGSRLSYTEVMPAGDFREIAVKFENERTCDVRWELFAEFLEKGVIRRARLQSAFVPRDNDTACVAALCQEIERRPLPLTT